MITLKNWNNKQPERLTFIELNFQDDQEVLCELIKNNVTRDQWNKTIDKFAKREIHRMEFENISGELHCWVYFKEGE